MKPIILKIKGINSFIEEQTIDFTSLTQLGLFGIFGPTGSGKSTILDGITLALYGEIPRARNLSTKKDLSGIINTQCQQGMVYYEFEMGSPDEQKRYMVSRSFKKDGQGNVKTNRVLLCDITHREEPVVLEEKVTPLNHRMVEIIGLTSEDFTRSVVLPQGNFSDFLKLSGKDRRNMLERIFALQEYGSQLTQRIRSRKRQVEGKYSFIQGQLTALDGVSQEGLDALKGEIKSLQKEYDEKERSLHRTKKEFERAGKLWELTKEYEEAKKKREDHQKQEAAIQRYRGQLELALRAKELMPYIRQEEELAGQLEGVREEYSDLLEQLKTTHDELKVLKENWAAIQIKKEGELPKLLEKKNRLEVALEQKRKVLDLESQLEELSKGDAHIGVRMEREGKKLTHMGEKLQVLQGRIKEARKKQTELQVSSQYKNELFKAYHLEGEVQRLERERIQLEGELEDIREKDLKPLFVEQRMVEDKLAHLEASQAQLSEELEGVKREIHTLEQQNMAALLAQELEDGEACPVCGGLDHPRRATFPQASDLEGLKRFGEDLNQSLEGVVEQLQKEGKVYQGLITKITILEEKLKEGQERAKQIELHLEKLREDVGAYQRKLNIESAQEAYEELKIREARLEVIQKDLGRWEVQREDLEKALQRLQEEERRSSNERIRIGESMAHLQRQLGDLQLEIQRITREDPEQAWKRVKEEIHRLEEDYRRIKGSFESKNEEKIKMESRQKGLEDTMEQLEKAYKKSRGALEERLEGAGFDHRQEVLACFKGQEECRELEGRIRAFEEKRMTMDGDIRRLLERIRGEFVGDEEWSLIRERKEQEEKELEEIKTSLIKKQALVKEMEGKLEEWKILSREKEDIQHKKSLLEELDGLFLGNKFIEFISTYQLRYIAADASQQLKRITRGRYALELDSQGNFIMRDDFNGGVRRGTQTLSGGETFLTSLSLALALSSHIQLKGSSPLEFFFLDEGFGTLDPELLDVVINSLERLHSERLKVGIISHVEELRQRIPRKLIVDPAIPGIRGSRVTLELG